MALYVYECENHHQIEAIRPLSERNNPLFCPQCNTPARRVYVIQSVIYRSGGFTTTDSRVERQQVIDKIEQSL